MTKNTDFELLRSASEAARRRAWQEGLGIMFGASPVLALVMHLAETQPWAIGLGGIGLFAWGARTLILENQRTPHRLHLLKALQEKPEDLVWAYRHDEVVESYGIEARRDSTFQVGLSNGVKLPLRPPDGNLEAAFDAVSRLAPGAVLGYSQAMEESFRKDPASLYYEAAEPDITYGNTRAQELRLDLSESGNWEGVLDSLAALPDWEERDFFVGVLRQWPTRESWVEQATEQRPDSAEAWLLRGAHSVHWAWVARGRGEGDQVGQASADLFLDRLDNALGELQRAAELAPADPTPYAYLLRCARGLQLDPEASEEWYQELKTRDPLHRSGHSQMLQNLCDKWGGDDQKMATFARQVTASAPEGHGIHSLIAEAHLELWLSDESGQHFQNPEVASALLEAYQRSLGSPQYRETVSTPYDRHLFAFTLWMANCRQQAGDELERLLGEAVVALPWGYLGDSQAIFQEALGDCLSAETVRDAGV